MTRKSWIFFRHRLSVFAHDIAWVPAAIFLSYWIRFNIGTVPDAYLQSLYWMCVLAVPIYACLFWYLGLYRGVWRFASIPDLIRVFKAVFLGTLATSLAIFVLQRSEGVPRSVFFLYPILLSLGLVMPRVIYRWIVDHRIGRGFQRRRALIVGSGRPAEILIRNLMRTRLYLPVAMVDSDRMMLGREIHGVRVEGELKNIASIIKELSIECVLLAFSDPSSENVNLILRVCSEARIPCRTTSDHRIDQDDPWGSDSQLRPISVIDLLPREPVQFDSKDIADYLRGKCVLISGAGGSIGSELTRQVAENLPDSLILFENSEFNLFQIEQSLRRSHPHLRAVPVLGDVKDKYRVEWLFKTFSPQVVFHAAAYKHVPLLQGNPIQAVQNNVLGTKILADAAHKSGSERFVLISTDKAVNPSNTMGVTKRIAEIYCQNLNGRSATNFITTRFGNVLGSAGSVVPIFEQQIAQGGPLTVTHPEITRYFMTISEAVTLILQAASMSDEGAIFVMDMGHPIKINDLAEQMIRLAGQEPHQDIKIEYTGLRDGEKLHEELFHESEDLIGTSHPKLLLSAHRQIDWDWLTKEFKVLESAVQEGNIDLVMDQLQVLVPEFTRADAEKPDSHASESVIPISRAREK